MSADEDVDGASDQAVALGPVKPSPEVRAELGALLESDQTRLGDVYRGLQLGLDADAIAAHHHVGTSGFVWNYTQIIVSLTDGTLPTGPTVALQVARKFRKLLQTAVLSPAARRCLEQNLVELERRANDVTARIAEVQIAQKQTEVAESRNDTGIYVYALPHYLRYPFDPSTGRTLMKVGKSDNDVIMRFRNQTRTTALPEEPILLRIYRTGPAEAGRAEASFHRLLDAADHTRSVARTAGREWFVTSTRFLDEIANVMQLSPLIVNETTVDDEE